MQEEAIDFGNLSRKILVNPIVPLQLINIKCRNNTRVQATILGKIYSNAIEILEIVPVGLCEENKIKTIDFVEHQRSLDNIMTVYPTLQILGVAVTDLKPDIQLAFLHTMYSNKQSGFKAQGILLFPIILSISTIFSETSVGIPIEAYSFNHTYKFCKDLMDVTAFEKLDVTISLGDTQFESIAPLFEAMNDQEKVVPGGDAKQKLVLLAQRLKELKVACDRDQNSNLKVRLRAIVDRLNFKHDYTMEQLSYLLDLAGLQKRITLKMNKFQ